MTAEKTEKLITNHLKKSKIYLENLVKKIGDPSHPRKGSSFINDTVLSQSECELLCNIYSCNIRQINVNGDGTTWKLVFF